MSTYHARKLAEYHKFTRLELYNILKDALEKEPSAYWEKPNNANKSFTNGYFFNCCVKWLEYEEGVNEETFPNEIVAVRVLQGFRKWSKIQLPQKKTILPEYVHHEKPKL